jgi:hypothetical protein
MCDKGFWMFDLRWPAIWCKKKETGQGLSFMHYRVMLISLRVLSPRYRIHRRYSHRRMQDLYR